MPFGGDDARALTWDAVDLGDPHAAPPRPASIAVWRSVRAHGDTKTAKSRRTLGLPSFATQALAGLQQREHRTTGPEFATRDGGQLDAANIRREFNAAITATGIDGTWTPRELLHTFVSLMSDSGVPVEEIARLAGHTNSRATEIVYRHQLRPVIEKAPKPSTSSSDTQPDIAAATLGRAEYPRCLRARSCCHPHEPEIRNEVRMGNAHRAAFGQSARARGRTRSVLARGQAPALPGFAGRSLIRRPSARAGPTRPGGLGVTPYDYCRHIQRSECDHQRGRTHQAERR